MNSSLVLFFWLTAFFVVNVASPVKPGHVQCPWPGCPLEVPENQMDEHYGIHSDGCGPHYIHYLIC